MQISSTGKNHVTQHISSVIGSVVSAPQQYQHVSSQKMFRSVSLVLCTKLERQLLVILSDKYNCTLDEENKLAASWHMFCVCSSPIAAVRILPGPVLGHIMQLSIQHNGITL